MFGDGRRTRVRLVAGVAVLALAAAACSSSGSDGEAGPSTTGVPSTSEATAGEAGGGIDADQDRGGGSVDLDVETEPVPFDVATGVESVTVTGAEPGTPITLLTESGVRIVTGPADDAGQFHIGYVPREYTEVETTITAEGSGDGGTLHTGDYLVAVEGDDTLQLSEPVEVAARGDVPDDAFFDQDITPEAQ